MQAVQTPISPEVRAYAEVQREREFRIVDTEAKRRWWRRLGARILDLSPDQEHLDLSAEIVTADEIVNRAEIEAQAQRLISNFEHVPKNLREMEAEDNARTALFEALTGSGHLSIVELSGAPDEVHNQVLQRLLNSYFRNGISEHERARNFAEICEELTVQAIFEAIMRGDIPPDTKIVSISDFAHPLGKDADKHGYRSENKKGMVRETTLSQREDGVYVRIIKQVSRSSTYAPETINALRRSKIPFATRHGESDIQLLSNQFLSVRHGAIEVVQLLDRLHRGAPVRYGEAIRPGSVPYESLEQVSRDRELAVERHVNELADYERQLDRLHDEGRISVAEQQKRYVEAVRAHVRAICVEFPGYTKDALGDAVVKDYEKAHSQYLRGDTAGAAGTIGAASSRESAVVICGMSTNAQKDPNNPNNGEKSQTTKSILERSMESDWERKVKSCPICYSPDITAKKIGDRIYGQECGCWSDVCTGMSHRGPGKDMSLGAAKDRRTRPVDTKNKRPMHNEAVRGYGKNVVTRKRVIVGRMAIDLVEQGSGVVLQADVRQNTFTLAS